MLYFSSVDCKAYIKITIAKRSMSFVPGMDECFTIKSSEPH